MVTQSPPETLLANMLERLVDQFQPEQVYLIDFLASGNQRRWHHADFLVVLDGEWDDREKSLEIREGLHDTGFGKDIYLSTPKKLAQRRGQVSSPEYRAVHEGRLLYERG